MHIVLTRHGQVEGIDPPRFRGRMELDLTDVGRHQAQALGSAIAGQFQVDAVFTSPMKRCRDTGAAIAQASSAPQHVLPGIDDFDYGDWQWMTLADAKAQYPREFALWKRSPQWMCFPGGESLQKVAWRSVEALRDLWDEYRDGTVALVAHDSVNRILLMHALELPLSAYWRIEQEPCCINELFVGDDGVVKVMRMNDTTHLRMI